MELGNEVDSNFFRSGEGLCYDFQLIIKDKYLIVELWINKMSTINCAITILYKE